MDSDDDEKNTLITTDGYKFDNINNPLLTVFVDACGIFQNTEILEGGSFKFPKETQINKERFERIMGHLEIHIHNNKFEPKGVKPNKQDWK